MNTETDVKELLQTKFPLREELPSDWHDVLVRARISPAAATRDQMSHGSMLAVGRRRLPVLVGMLALAAAVLGAIAFWPSNSPHGGILQRALAAVGDGPIIHIVYRDQAAETLVDLATGQRTSLADQHEVWYDPSEGLREVTSFNGTVQDTFVDAADKIPSQDQQTDAGILNGYRQALQDGTATLSPEQTFDGQQVYWVQFQGQMYPNVADGKEHDFSHEVAIDASSYQPIYVRETLDGQPGPDTGESILSVDTMPAGSIDFTPTPRPQPGTHAMRMGAGSATDLTSQITSSAPAQALGATPLWLGQSYDNLPLAYAQSQPMFWGPPGETPTKTTGLEVCYGSIDPNPIPAGINPTSCNETGPHVLLQEATQLTPRFGGSLFGSAVTIPSGSVLIGWNPTDGYLVDNGVYIHISAQSEDAVLAVAKALQPIQPTTGG
jgi:hypothetical protein